LDDIRKVQNESFNLQEDSTNDMDLVKESARLFSKTKSIDKAFITNITQYRNRVTQLQKKLNYTL